MAKITSTETVWDQLRKDAYSTATAMTNSPVPIGNDTVLKKSLERYTKKEFKDRFGFDYDAMPPDYASGATPTRYQLLGYLEDDIDHEKLNGFVVNYLDGLSELDETTKGELKTDIQTQLGSFADDPVIRDWGIGISDKTYQRSDSALNPIRFSAVVGYFFKGETSLWRTTSSVTFVYILGMLYEVTLIQDILRADLLNELCDNVEHQIDSQKSARTWSDLTNLLSRFAKQQFKHTFNFEWTGVNTLASYSVLLRFEGRRSSQEIEDYVSAMVFRKDGSEFPSKAVQEALFGDLVDTIIFLAEPGEPPRDNNAWYDVSRERSFAIDPTNAGSRLIKQYTTFVYALGQKSAKDVHIEEFCVYYLAAFYDVPSPSLE